MVPGTGYQGTLAPIKITFYAGDFSILTWDINSGVFVNRTKFPDPPFASCPPPGPCWRVISDTDLEVRLPASLTGAGRSRPCQTGSPKGAGGVVHSAGQWIP